MPEHFCGTWAHGSVVHCEAKHKQGTHTRNENNANDFNATANPGSGSRQWALDQIVAVDAYGRYV